MRGGEGGSCIIFIYSVFWVDGWLVATLLTVRLVRKRGKRRGGKRDPLLEHNPIPSVSAYP